jgi:hypothetical protein
MDMSPSVFVEYLNNMMESSRGMVEIGKEQLIPKITMTDDQKFIKIPKALYRDDKNLTLSIAQTTQL